MFSAALRTVPIIFPLTFLIIETALLTASFLDTPPLQAVTDAQILSTKVDGTLIVVRSGVTKKDAVNNAVSIIKKVNGNIIGTVLNAAENNKNTYYYYGD